MKKRILAFLLAMLMVVPMALTLLAAEAKEEEEVKIDYTKAVWANKEARLAKMELYGASPDGNMLLYLDPKSGEMGIKNVKTGDIHLSNPYDVADSLLYKREKPFALSQLDISFIYNTNPDPKNPKVLNSYGDCFSVGQATVVKLPNGNGVRVSYIIGVQEQRLLVPNKIKKDDFEAVLEELRVNIVPDVVEMLTQRYGRAPTEEEIETQINNYVGYILQKYTLYGPKTTPPSNSASEEEKEAALKYPYTYTGKYNFVDISEKEANAFKGEYPVTANEYVYIINDKGAEHTDVEGYLKKYTSYTFEKLDADYAKVKESVDNFSGDERPKFEIEATYEITNEGLVASVDASTLKYNREKYTVTAIALLPYFDAGNSANTVPVNSKETISVSDKGYVFLPDGSGTLIRFEDLVAQSKYTELVNQLYGNDYAKYQISISNSESVSMPVFGLANETKKTGFFAVIEDGDALASIVSNHTRAYHSVYSRFEITPTDVYDLADSFSGGVSNSKEITIISEKEYKGICKVNYVMLVDESVADTVGYGENDYYENSYVGMAKFYREYLQKKNAISVIPSSSINKEFTKIFLEAFGSVKAEEQIATFPVTVNKELTTFNDIMDIHKELKSLGVGNISFVLKGFANGGLIASYPTKIKWQKVLGGEDGLNELLAYAKENNIDVIPDVEFSYSYGSSKFGSGFKTKTQAVRTLDNRYTTKRAYYAASQTFERTGGIAVSAATFDYMYEKFYESISEYDIEYLSVRSLGSDLNSDYDKDEYYDREASKDNVVAMLKLLKGESGNKGFKLLLETGNSYAIPYADSILSAPIDSSHIGASSESVPFFGMVYHGFIEFAGKAYNMEGDSEYAFLKAIENGAVLYFTIAKQNVELLKFEREYSKYYSINYSNLKDTIKNKYNEYNSVMKDLQDKLIVDHGFIDTAIRTEDGGKANKSQVVMVEYEGGVGFVLNYTDYEIQVEMPNGEMTTIEPLGYQRYEK